MYIKTLESAGYTCEYLQTLQFEFVNISELRACLSTADKYSGLILTSPRTVEAISLVVKKDVNILYSWQQIPVYCIGPTTDSLARNQLNLQHCIGSESDKPEPEALMRAITTAECLENLTEST
ncbi:uroporphyrinogen-III synthase [Camponotus japonicus]